MYAEHRSWQLALTLPPQRCRCGGKVKGGVTGKKVDGRIFLGVAFWPPSFYLPAG